MKEKDEMKYCWSTNEETYYGEFDTIEQAIEGARDENEDEVKGCWIAEVSRPEFPLEIDGQRMIDEYFERWYELHSEWHERQFNETAEQVQDLERRIETAWKEWREANGIKTHGYNAENAKFYLFVDPPSA